MRAHFGAQNGLGLKGFLLGRGCEYITTDKKEGPDNGKSLLTGCYGCRLSA